MISISLCMIVKNEEEVLHRCLSSVKDICDEIIIIDTGSTDKTKEIARVFTDKVLDFEWIDDFAAARNFAFSQAKMDYIFWMDADDVLLNEDQEKFLRLKKTLESSYDAVSFIYNIAFDEYGSPTFSYRRNRLVKSCRDFKWVGFVHEYLEVSGNILSADIAITHRKSDKINSSERSGRNLAIYEARLERGDPFTPRDLYYYANELKDHRQYLKAIMYYREFLATKKGWVEDEIRACAMMAECYQKLGNKDKEKEALALSLKYDTPRPEISCRFGDLYKADKSFRKAIIWYKLALEGGNSGGQGFNQPAYSTWYPHLQLCVAYWEIGEKDLSIEHHLHAKKYRPDDASVRQNDEFFKNYIK
ncbi:glycosyltransferase family 2 protein [Metabacillus sp. KIGAM252]|uniref:Glycosyltransferase family 2 protein n=1 Tax=Metabacillus flavus TaxID=2823519 RepID=A0ABS5LBQ7_9BACI|nr:glycosyltransferase family 2 protein [Metabacillus flavus]MBS2967894.1 glycosyltransferase family 2 protein [Metabacillus flavus]